MFTNTVSLRYRQEVIYLFYLKDQLCLKLLDRLQLRLKKARASVTTKFLLQWWGAISMREVAWLPNCVQWVGSSDKPDYFTMQTRLPIALVCNTNYLYYKGSHMKSHCHGTLAVILIICITNGSTWSLIVFSFAHKPDAKIVIAFEKIYLKNTQQLRKGRRKDSIGLVCWNLSFVFF